jgi:hypothetical protein
MVENRTVDLVQREKGEENLMGDLLLPSDVAVFEPSRTVYCI